MDSIFNDAVKEIIPLYTKCITKAANDFIEGKKVDCESLISLHDSIRVLHHLKKISEGNE
ncbi:MAG: hypothetical protein ACM3TR_10940 [Caulobacteraceae bacterium]